MRESAFRSRNADHSLSNTECMEDEEVVVVVANNNPSYAECDVSCMLFTAIEGGSADVVASFAAWEITFWLSAIANHLPLIHAMNQT